MKLRFILLLTYLSINLSFAQMNTIDSLQLLIEQSQQDTSRIQLMLQLSREHFGTDPQKGIEISEDALELSNSINYYWGIANSYKYMGNGNYYISNYVDALVYWKQAKDTYEEINDQKGVANMLSNMGAIYSDQGFLVKALESYLESLRIAEEIKDSSRIATVTQNIGALHDKSEDWYEALKSYQKALLIFESLNNTNGIGLTSRNIAAIYHYHKNYDSTEVYAKKAMKYLDGSPYYSQAMSLLGLVQINRGNVQDGMSYLHESYDKALSIGNDVMIGFALSELSLGYYEIGDIENAILYKEEALNRALEISYANEAVVDTSFELVQLYNEIGDIEKAKEYEVLNEAAKDSMLSLESAKAQNRLLFDYAISKKENEIEMLRKENEIQKSNEQRQKLIKNGFVIGFLTVLVFAGVFFMQRNRIKKGKVLSDNLLHNILPSEVAEELKEKGESSAKHFEEVSVLFSDFKGFTSISEKLSAQELVAELNTCFKAFDGIITSHGLEKIKTIGDSYMAAGGLHLPRTSSTKDVIMAGLAMQEYIIKRKIELESNNRPFFEMRVGIHTGPVVAGIVGVKKFQYDIWGDTVNTASRIESSGEVGKVNISETTYALIKDHPNFSFEKRGKIQAKGKGEIEMYFVAKKV